MESSLFFEKSKKVISEILPGGPRCLPSSYGCLGLGLSWQRLMGSGFSTLENSSVPCTVVEQGQCDCGDHSQGKGGRMKDTQQFLTCNKFLNPTGQTL